MYSLVKMESLISLFTAELLILLSHAYVCEYVCVSVSVCTCACAHVPQGVANQSH